MSSIMPRKVFWLNIVANMNGDHNAGLVRRAVKYSMTAFLTVHLKTKLLCYTDQVFGFNLWKKRTHAAT